MTFRGGFSLISLLCVDRGPGGAWRAPLPVLTVASVATCFPHQSGLE